MRIRALSLLALLLLAGPVSAHDKWIEAEPFFRAAPGPVKLYLVTGESLRDAELLPLRRRAAVSRFQMHRSTGQHDLAAALREDQQPVAVVEPGQVPVGTSVVLLDMAPVDIELPAEKFESYLFSERLFDVLVLRAKMRQEEAPGRERYTLPQGDPAGRRPARHGGAAAARAGAGDRPAAAS